MGTETGLALRQGGALEISTLTDVERLASIAVASGLVQVRRAEEAAMLLITGRELGLSPMQSLRGIYVVNGRPVLSADLLVAIVRRSGLCESWRTVESTATTCTIETLRRGETAPARKTWTADDARRASLAGKGTWGAYPAQMLRHRCAADLAREVYPDVVLGLYAPEEFGAEDPSGTPRGASNDQDDVPPQDDKPEGSRAFAAFVLRVTSLPSVTALLTAYHALIADLREEGHDPAEYLADGADDPAALGAASLVGQRVWSLGHRLAKVDLTALLTDGGEKIAAGLDSQAEALAGKQGVDFNVACVEWWRAHAEEYRADKALQDVLWSALARRWAGGDEPPDGPRTKRAKTELKAAIVTAEGNAKTLPTGSTQPQARRVREVLPGTEAEIRAHVGGYGHPRAVEYAARKYVPMPALHRALADRLLALVPADADGTRLTERGAMLQVEAWSRQEPAAARKAAGVR